jgi:nitroreductase
MDTARFPGGSIDRGPATARAADEAVQRIAAVDDTIRQRYAARAFSSRDVPRELAEQILEVARYAPSGANTQPWRVYVLSGLVKAEVEEALSAAHRDEPENHCSEYTYYSPNLPDAHRARREEFGRIFYGWLQIDQADAAARARQTAKNYRFFGAPVGLVFTIDRRLAVGSWLDLGMFIQNVMIAAGVRGLRTCPQETLAKYHAVLRPRLDIPDEELVVCGMSLGFPMLDQPSPPRLPKAPVAEFARFLGFEVSAACDPQPESDR